MKGFVIKGIQPVWNFTKNKIHPKQGFGFNKTLQTQVAFVP